MIVSVQTQLIALGVAAALAFGAGWKTRDAFCDAADAKRQVADLRKQIDAAEAASIADGEALKSAQDELSKMEGVARDLQTRIGAGKCFSRDDVDRLRDLWKR